MGKYTKIDPNAFKQIQMNAGIIAKTFNPATAEVTDILGATTGGFSFNANPEYVDFGEDVDNVPANTWQLKKVMSYDPTASGTFLTVTPALAKMLSGAGSISTTKIVPSHELTEDDFQDVWIVGDYSDIVTGDNAGYVAIHIMNALNTAGFQIQTTKNNKGQFAFEFHGHYDLSDIDTVPFEIYVKAGNAE